VDRAAPGGKGGAEPPAAMPKAAGGTAVPTARRRATRGHLLRIHVRAISEVQAHLARRPAPRPDRGRRGAGGGPGVSQASRREFGASHSGGAARGRPSPAPRSRWRRAGRGPRGGAASRASGAMAPSESTAGRARAIGEDARDRLHRRPRARPRTERVRSPGRGAPLGGGIGAAASTADTNRVSWVAAGSAPLASGPARRAGAS